MRRLLAGAAVAVAVAVVSVPAFATEGVVVYRNAKVLTVDEGFQIAAALATRGDRILAVGSEADVRAAAGDDVQIADLEGRTVIPGLIDNHVHMIRASATWAAEVRLDGVRTRKEALSRIRERAAAAPKGRWLYTLGGFADEQFSDDARWLTRAELDAAAPNHPVYLQHMYSHAYVNAAAVAAAGLSEAEIRELAASGEMPLDKGGLPLGPIAGRAMSRIKASIPSLSEDYGRAGALAIARDHAAAGLTSVFDMGGFGIRDENYAPFAELDVAGRLPIRVFYTRWFRNDDGPRGRDAFAGELRDLRPLSGSSRFRLIGAGELLYLPMMDSVDRPGSARADHLAEFERILRALAEAGWPVRIHAESDVTISRHLDIVERIAADIPIARLRWTFEHADGVSERSLQRMKALGMAAALHSRPLVFGSRRLAAVGDRAFGLPPLRRVQDSGVAWGLGSDSVMANGYDPFATLWWAVSGKGLDGRTVTHPTLTREEALIAHTRANAFLLFAENEIGSLEPGKMADFVVLSDDYLTVPEDRIRDIRAVLTVVGGDVVHDARPAFQLNAVKPQGARE